MLVVQKCFFFGALLDAQNFLSLLHHQGLLKPQANLLQKIMQSTVVYDASQGYDEDTWDDSALIKAYDRAKESSRCSKGCSEIVVLFLSLNKCFLCFLM